MWQDNLFRELIVDNFAGGGGASTGIELALGCPVDIAINHDADAIAMHKVNHPYTAHYQEDVFTVDPYAVTGGRRVGLLWASPDCKHFSRAKGGTPVSKHIRGLSWVVLKWAMHPTASPRIVMMENVEEIQTWGPLKEIGGQVYYIRDVGLRMLKARELKLAQGFPPDYVIDIEPYIGKKYSEAKQIARLGNAVCPPVAQALVRANCAEIAVSRRMSTMAQLHKMMGRKTMKEATK